MSMLAGPRRKQKVINLRAKNNAWSNDNNKFGQRMLEKMGWSSGKGLGANENGIVEHVVARYKNDEKGLGFEDRNDQWTKTEDDFNALLANLSNDDAIVEKLHSGISLEVKSKKSKARVHYHKFTRGKDLTRYSEKDLANIFGKKTLKNQDKEEKVISEEFKEVKDVKETEQLFTEKGSMEDYFKSKLAAFNTKSTFMFNNNVNKEEDGNAEYVFKGFSTNYQDDQNTNNISGFQPLSFLGSKTEESSNINLLETNVTCDDGMRKQKKKKKSKKSNSDKCVSELDLTSETQNQVEKENSVSLEVNAKKKKKKSKHVDMEVENVIKSKKNKIDNSIEGDPMPPQKSKKDRQEYSEVIPEGNISKKNKKNKTKSLSPETENGQKTDVDIDCHIPKKKKKKNKC